MSQIYRLLTPCSMTKTFMYILLCSKNKGGSLFKWVTQTNTTQTVEPMYIKTLVGEK